MSAVTKITFFSFVLAVFGGMYLMGFGAVEQENAVSRAYFEQPKKHMVAKLAPQFVNTQIG